MPLCAVNKGKQQDKTSVFYSFSRSPPPHHLFLSSPLGRSCVSVVSVSPEGSVVPGGTASLGYQDLGKLPLVQPLAQVRPPRRRLNQSLTLTPSLTQRLPHSPKLTLDLNPLLVLKQPLSQVPALSPNTAPGYPVQRGPAGLGWCGSAESPGSAQSPEAWLGTLQSPGNPRSAGRNRYGVRKFSPAVQSANKAQVS